MSDLRDVRSSASKGAGYTSPSVVCFFFFSPFADESVLAISFGSCGKLDCFIARLRPLILVISDSKGADGNSELSRLAGWACLLALFSRV